MSAKPCYRCGGVIVFGKEQDTGKIIPLSVGSKVYRVIKENIVALDPKALVPHVCVDRKPIEPSPARDFHDPESSRE